MQHLPLGVLGVHCWTRKKAKGKRSRKAVRDDRTKESLRWGRQVDATEQRMRGAAEIVHVMDREADSYELFSHLASQGHRFVIRAAHDRVLGEHSHGSRKLFEALKNAAVLLERDVPLSPRKDAKRTPQQRRIHPSRRHRVARLQIGALSLVLRRSGYASSRLPETLKLNVVVVREIDTPTGQVPVEWILLTTERVNTAEEVAAVVDAYRARWVIEEYFKALKTGCEYQKLQLKSYDALVRSLAIYMPIAWQLLVLRNLARATPNESATRILTPTQLDVLRAIAPTLPKKPTLQEAMLAIAARGGHIKNNGQPGWLVIGRGLRDLLLMEQGWAEAQQALTTRCDHS